MKQIIKYTNIHITNIIPYNIILYFNAYINFLLKLKQPLSKQ